MQIDFNIFATSVGLIITVTGIAIKYLTDKIKQENTNITEKIVSPLKDKILTLEINFANEKAINENHKIECDIKHTETDKRLSHQNETIVNKMDIIMAILKNLETSVAVLDDRDKKK